MGGGGDGGDEREGGSRRAKLGAIKFCVSSCFISRIEYFNRFVLSKSLLLFKLIREEFVCVCVCMGVGV